MPRRGVFDGATMLRRCALALFICLLLTPCPARASNDLPALAPDIWDALVIQATMLPGTKDLPGRLHANADEDVRSYFDEAWPYRAVTYEIYYPDQRFLARSVYSLAIHAGDVPENVDVGRFNAGVQGFHYKVADVCAWMNALEAGQAKPHGPAGRKLAGWLVRDKVVRKGTAGWEPAGNITHILATSSGRTRSLERNLAHERVHVLWDEDPAMRARYTAAFEALSPEAKEAAHKTLAQYRQDHALLVKEWAIRQAEDEMMRVQGWR